MEARVPVYPNDHMVAEAAQQIIDIYRGIPTNFTMSQHPVFVNAMLAKIITLDPNYQPYLDLLRRQFKCVVDPASMSVLEYMTYLAVFESDMHALHAIQVLNGNLKRWNDHQVHLAMRRGAIKGYKKIRPGSQTGIDTRVLSILESRCKLMSAGTAEQWAIILKVVFLSGCYDAKKYIIHVASECDIRCISYFLGDDATAECCFALAASTNAGLFKNMLVSPNKHFSKWFETKLETDDTFLEKIYEVAAVNGRVQTCKQILETGRYISLDCHKWSFFGAIRHQHRNVAQFYTCDESPILMDDYVALLPTFLWAARLYGNSAIEDLLNKSVVDPLPPLEISEFIAIFECAILCKHLPSASFCIPEIYKSPDFKGPLALDALTRIASVNKCGDVVELLEKSPGISDDIKLQLFEAVVQQHADHKKALGFGARGLLRVLFDALPADASVPAGYLHAIITADKNVV